MSNAIERRSVLTIGEKITHVNIIDGGKAVEVFWLPDYGQKELKVPEEGIEEYFHPANLSTLSVDDEFLKHEPETKNQREFKKRLIEAIKSGLSDILAPRMDPSFDEDENICFKVGKMPAIGKTEMWWKLKAAEFMPERGSRQGTTNERIAFLGLLIKKTLIEELGYSVCNAWRNVCDQSENLGHYWDSKNAKHIYEPTGSRQVGEWYDLANTCKITSDGENHGFSIVGGYYDNFGDMYPLANVVSSDDNYNFNSWTGWIVLQKKD